MSQFYLFRSNFSGFLPSLNESENSIIRKFLNSRRQSSPPTQWFSIEYIISWEDEQKIIGFNEITFVKCVYWLRSNIWNQRTKSSLERMISKDDFKLAEIREKTAKNRTSLVLEMIREFYIAILLKLPLTIDFLNILNILEERIS